MAPSTLYDRVGGEEFFDQLTRRFYRNVSADPVLRPLYPADEADFEASRGWLRDFLVQYWGGPAVYNERRGHPRLRMRHLPFAIGTAERDAWLACMTRAVGQAEMGGLERSQMLTYFEAAAAHMVNQPT